jgi:hypothetical protein
LQAVDIYGQTFAASTQVAGKMVQQNVTDITAGSQGSLLINAKNLTTVFNLTSNTVTVSQFTAATPFYKAVVTNSGGSNVNVSLILRAKNVFTTANYTGNKTVVFKVTCQPIGEFGGSSPPPLFAVLLIGQIGNSSSDMNFDSTDPNDYFVQEFISGTGTAASSAKYIAKNEDIAGNKYVEVRAYVLKNGIGNNSLGQSGFSELVLESVFLSTEVGVLS